MEVLEACLEEEVVVFQERSGERIYQGMSEWGHHDDSEEALGDHCNTH